MKTKVVISADSGIEAVPAHPIVGVLPDEIRFSDVEVYKSALEMDFQAFNLRMKMDPYAKPTITGCSEAILIDKLEDINLDGYDRFFFVLSSQKMAYYKPLIERYIKSVKKVQAFYYTVKSEGIAVAYMSVMVQRMFDKGASIPEVEKALDFYDANNVLYLYSPGEDKIPEVKKFSVDDEAFEIKGRSSLLYVMRKNDSTVIHLREKSKTIEPYLDLLVVDMDEKKVFPFVLYTNPNSEYTRVFLKEYGKNFMTADRVKAYEMSPQMSLKYGKNSIAMGYICKYEKEA